ncbi:MAG TPA: hypothetical protein VKA95_10775 [Nitrososphaeraceae archaeon]|nr:hypothetical protein [Nitrososphaeraceae archaeon]
MSYFDPNLQQRISERLANLFTPVNRIDRILYTVIKEFMDYYVVPYFTDVITRHTEEEFHKKIAEGFDLVEDMRINHPHLFNGFMRVTKKFQKRLVFNENIMVDMIVDIVQSPPYNWRISTDEHAKLFGMVSRLKMEIYS